MSKTNQTRAILLATVMVASMFAVAAPAAAQSTESVSITDATVESNASSGSVDVVADIPNGVSNINLTVSLDNTSVADLDGVNDEAGFGTGFKEDAGESTTDTNTFAAADLGGAVSAGENQTLFSIDLTNFSDAGSSSDITVTVNEFTDDDGASVSPSTSAGQINVSAQADGGSDDSDSDGGGSDDDDSDDGGSDDGETFNSSVSISDTTVESSASSGSVDVVADLPNGVKVINLTVSLANSSVADIDGINDEAGFGSGFQEDAGPSTADTNTFRAADLAGVVSSGQNVTLFSIDLTNFSDAGSSSDITVTVNEFTDDDDASVSPSTSAGQIDISAQADGGSDDGDSDDGGSDDTVTTNSSVSITNTTVDPSASSDSVDIVADLPSGVQTVNLTVSLDNTSVADLDGVNDEAGFGTGFQEDAGESTVDTNTFRAADLAGVVSSGQNITLFSVDLTNFGTPGSSSNITVTVNKFTDGNGNSVTPAISDGQINITKPVFSGPIAGNENAPADLNGDGYYEDVNGDGEVNFDDAVSVAFAGDLTEAQQSALDFDGDGDVDFDDAVELAFSS